MLIILEMWQSGLMHSPGKRESRKGFMGSNPVISASKWWLRGLRRLALKARVPLRDRRFESCPLTQGRVKSNWYLPRFEIGYLGNWVCRFEACLFRPGCFVHPYMAMWRKGSRSRIRICRRKAWEFESPHGHNFARVDKRLSRHI